MTYSVLEIVCSTIIMALVIIGIWRLIDFIPDGIYDDIDKILKNGDADEDT